MGEGSSALASLMASANAQAKSFVRDIANKGATLAGEALMDMVPEWLPRLLKGIHAPLQSLISTVTTASEYIDEIYGVVHVMRLTANVSAACKYQVDAPALVAGLTRSLAPSAQAAFAVLPELQSSLRAVASGSSQCLQQTDCLTDLRLLVHETSTRLDNLTLELALASHLEPAANATAWAATQLADYLDPESASVFDILVGWSKALVMDKVAKHEQVRRSGPARHMAPSL